MGKLILMYLRGTAHILFRVGEVLAPLLLIQGLADSLRLQQDDMHVELRRHKKDVQYILYPGERHSEIFGRSN
jgi:dipeptidyl aminopeptidase/acylaminoacyl peptidase